MVNNKKASNPVSLGRVEVENGKARRPIVNIDTGNNHGPLTHAPGPC